MTTRRDRPGGSGFTLIELVVSLLLLELILLGAVASMHLASTLVRRARVTETALWETAALADSIRAGHTDGSGRRSRAWGWIERAGNGVEARDSAGRRIVGMELPQ